LGWELSFPALGNLYYYSCSYAAIHVTHRNPPWLLRIFVIFHPAGEMLPERAVQPPVYQLKPGNDSDRYCLFTTIHEYIVYHYMSMNISCIYIYIYVYVYIYIYVRVNKYIESYIYIYVHRCMIDVAFGFLESHSITQIWHSETPMLVWTSLLARDGAGGIQKRCTRGFFDDFSNAFACPPVIKEIWQWKNSHTHTFLYQWPRYTDQDRTCPLSLSCISVSTAIVNHLQFYHQWEV